MDGTRTGGETINLADIPPERPISGVLLQRHLRSVQSSSGEHQRWFFVLEVATETGTMNLTTLNATLHQVKVVREMQEGMRYEFPHCFDRSESFEEQNE